MYFKYQEGNNLTSIIKKRNKCNDNLLFILRMRVCSVHYPIAFVSEFAWGKWYIFKFHAVNK